MLPHQISSKRSSNITLSVGPFDIRGVWNCQWVMWQWIWCNVCFVAMMLRISADALFPTNTDAIMLSVYMCIVILFSLFTNPKGRMQYELQYNENSGDILPLIHIRQSCAVCCVCVCCCQINSSTWGHICIILTSIHMQRDTHTHTQMRKRKTANTLMERKMDRWRTFQKRNLCDMIILSNLKANCFVVCVYIVQYDDIPHNLFCLKILMFLFHYNFPVLVFWSPNGLFSIC